MAHYTSGDVFELMDESTRTAFKGHSGPYVIEYVLTLNAGDTCDAAGTTKKVFAGPGKVTFRFYRDGGLDTDPSEGTTLRHLPRT